MKTACRNIIIYLALLVTFPLALAYSASLSLPRYSSIKSAKVNSRVGPGFEYTIAWNYERKHLPVEIIEEHGMWRRIQDANGDISWVHQALLGGVRTAIVRPAADEALVLVPLFANKSKSSYLISKIEKGTIVDLKSCDSQWCYVSLAQASGYIEKSCLWGVYSDELLH